MEKSALAKYIDWRCKEFLAQLNLIGVEKVEKVEGWKRVRTIIGGGAATTKTSIKDFNIHLKYSIRYFLNTL